MLLVSTSGSNVSTVPSCAWETSRILTNFGSLLLDVRHPDAKGSLSKDKADAPSSSG